MKPAGALSAGLPEQSSRTGRRLQDWLLCGYVVLLPVQISLTPSFRLAPSDLFLAVMLICAPFGLVRISSRRGTWSGWHLGLLIVFFLSSLVALLRQGYLTRTTLINKDLGLLVLFAAYVVLVSESSSWFRIRRILRLLIISTAVQNGMSMAAFFAARDLGLTIPGLAFSDPRLAGFLVDPNAYGGLLVVVLGLHMMNDCGKRPLMGSSVGKLISVSLAAGVLLTYSRSAWIGLSMVLAVAVMCRPKTGVYFAAGGAAAFLLVLKVLGSGYLGEMQSMAFRWDQVNVRIALIDDALPMFWQSPAIGTGLGVFGDRVGMIIHNTPLWILTECGLIGFCVFAGFITWFLWKSVVAYRMAGSSEKALLLGLITAYAAMIGLSMGIEALYQRHWWLVMALIASSYSLATTDFRRRGSRRNPFRRR